MDQPRLPERLSDAALRRLGLWPEDDPTAVLGDEDCAPAEPDWSDFSIDPRELEADF